jgi:hypothetical protein
MSMITGQEGGVWERLPREVMEQRLQDRVGRWQQLEGWSWQQVEGPGRWQL